MELSSWYDGWKFGSYRYSEVSNAFFFSVNSILPATRRDLFAKRNLLRNGPFFWDSFTLDRNWNAMALYRSQGIFRPLRALDMDEPHPDAVPDQSERVRPRTDKGRFSVDQRGLVSEKLFFWRVFVCRFHVRPLIRVGNAGL